MPRFDAADFIRSLNWFQTLEMTFGQQAGTAATQKVIDMFCSDLEEMNGHLEKMECRVSIKMSIRTQELMRVTGKFEGQVQQALKELRARIVDELGDRILFSIDAENAKLLEETKPLFGPRVALKLPSTAEDISEAAQCLALNRPTACVFHLMRVMETGVQILGNRLGVQLTADKNWQNILDEANKANKSSRPKGRHHQSLRRHLLKPL
jgi:hypothetical protein